MIELATAFDCGYLIMRDDHFVGGVFIKPNFMADLFVVPPYDDYEGLLNSTLSHLRTISRKGEEIVIREVVEEWVHVYQRNECRIHETTYWMIRPTQPIGAILPHGYKSKPVENEDVEQIATLIMDAYEANPVMRPIASREFYVRHVNNFLAQHSRNPIMDRCSQVVVHDVTNTVVGVCLHMEFEDYPLVMSLAVKPEHQHQGVGRYLLSHSINMATEAYPAIRLSVVKDNPAIKLYEGLGFIRNKSLTDMHLLV